MQKNWLCVFYQRWIYLAVGLLIPCNVFIVSCDNALILDYVSRLLLLVLWEMAIFVMLAKSMFQHFFFPLSRGMVFLPNIRRSHWTKILQRIPDSKLMLFSVCETYPIVSNLDRIIVFIWSSPLFTQKKNHEIRILNLGGAINMMYSYLFIFQAKWLKSREVKWLPQYISASAGSAGQESMSPPACYFILNMWRYDQPLFTEDIEAMLSSLSWC